MRGWLAGIGLLLVWAFPVHAEQPSQERILKLFEVTGVVEQTEGVIDQMLPLVIKQVGPPILRAARAQKSHVPPDFGRILNEEAQKASGQLGIEILIALVPVYQQSFTVDEVETPISFYDSDLGRRLKVAAQAMEPTACRIGRQLGGEKGRELVTNVLARLPKTDESLN